MWKSTCLLLHLLAVIPFSLGVPTGSALHTRAVSIADSADHQIDQITDPFYLDSAWNKTTAAQLSAGGVQNVSTFWHLLDGTRGINHGINASTEPSLHRNPRDPDFERFGSITVQFEDYVSPRIRSRIFSQFTGLLIADVMLTATLAGADPSDPFPEEDYKLDWNTPDRRPLYFEIRRSENRGWTYGDLYLTARCFRDWGLRFSSYVPGCALKSTATTQEHDPRANFASGMFFIGPRETIPVS